MGAGRDFGSYPLRHVNYQGIGSRAQGQSLTLIWGIAGSPKTFLGLNTPLGSWA